MRLGSLICFIADTNFFPQRQTVPHLLKNQNISDAYEDVRNDDAKHLQARNVPLVEY